MVSKDQFEKNIQTIVDSSIFTLPDEYKDEFLLSAILTRLEHPLKTSSITLLLRLVQILIKIDDEISEGEKEVLEKIKERLFHPKIKIKGVEVSEVPEGESFEDVMKELDELIGLAEIKKSIREFADFLKVQKIRETSGLKPVNNSLHTLFLGPPGTGKTTVARILGRIYKHLGYLEKGHLVETDRTGMVAGYIGQTAIKVDEIVTKAQEGVLFIDEAYSLSRDGDDKKDFGNEAIEVLLKRMEDKRDNFVVIAAGYNDEMKTFINSNPGLQSRFNRHFIFDHYHPEELLGIFELYCKKNDFELSEDAREKLFFIFEKLYEKKHKGFGNARVVRNLFEKVIENQSSRIIKISPITKELLIKIEEPDIPPVNQTVEKFLYFLQNQEEETEA
ncbi:AAA family ATPase [Lacihabitans sp. LS3-19]|nr:AAA family ATPase [Lacihabitans sp. LS3-19]